METDSPYFKIGLRRNSSPALVGMVTNLVADIRGQTWKEVLEVASRNERSLYQLQTGRITPAVTPRGGTLSTGYPLRSKFVQERCGDVKKPTYHFPIIGEDRRSKCRASQNFDKLIGLMSQL